MDLLWAYLKEQGPATAVIIIVIWMMLRELKSGQAEIKAEMAKTSKRLDCFEKLQYACQLDNAKEFATKEEVGKLWVRSDNHESRISRIEGKG